MKDLGRGDHLLRRGKAWLWQMEHTAWEPVSHVAFLWQGTRGDKINDEGQISTEQLVLVADVMPENNLSTEDIFLLRAKYFGTNG